MSYKLIVVDSCTVEMAFKTKYVVSISPHETTALLELFHL